MATFEEAQNKATDLKTRFPGAQDQIQVFGRIGDPNSFTVGTRDKVTSETLFITLREKREKPNEPQIL